MSDLLKNSLLRNNSHSIFFRPFEKELNFLPKCDKVHLVLASKVKESKANSQFKKGKSSARPRPSKEDASSTPQQNKQEKLAAMREFATEEKLLFNIHPPSENALKCIYAFPNTYTVGICSLGYQLVWAQLASSPDVHVSRLFTDASEPLMRNPDLVGFSLSWELDYANILSLLTELDIPIRSENRDESHPLIFGGGSVLTANPEPYADFFDVILLGDGENLLTHFLKGVESTRGTPGTRLEKLKFLSQIAGVYVPRLYAIEYESYDGKISKIEPIFEDVPSKIYKQTFKGENLALSTVVSSKMAWENIFMLEMVRSCPEMCRFCLASYVTLPFRYSSVDNFLIPSLEKGLEFTNRIGLLGASVTQHPHFDEFLNHLLSPQYDDVRLSIASVRTNTVTEKLCHSLSSRGTNSLTIAVESGSEKLRKIINKKLDTDEIFIAAKNAEKGNLKSLKIYSMVGLPGEDEEDIEKTIELMIKLNSNSNKLKFTLGCSTFVPKAHTPFQWHGLRKEGEGRMNALEKNMRQKHIEFRPESYKWSVVQSVLSRGDRRLSILLEKVKEYGESHGSFRRAFKELKSRVPSMEYYAFRHIEFDEILPWDHLQGPLPSEVLQKHYLESKQHFRA